MSVEVRVLDLSTDAHEWNRAVDRSTGTNPFYRSEALTLQAAETGTTVHPLAGYKGQEVVGLFPVFTLSKGPLAAAFSPPPRSWSCYLGPAMVNAEKLKRRKVDRRTRRFVEGCLDWLEDTFSPLYATFTVGEFDDLRPFAWNGYHVEPGYTYVVDLDQSEDTLLDQFSSDARRNIRSARDSAATITEGTPADVEAIVEQVAARYESQGRPFQLSPSYARSLYEELPEGTVRPYTCRIDGEFYGGILVVETTRSRYRWQGGVKLDDDVDVAINDLLDWHVMRDGIRDGHERYDLVGAGVPSINRYKAKFNPALESHYTVTNGVLGFDRLIDRVGKYL